ncbi:hypothetical protein HDU93_001354 [Gonapodya sp. JEL0774]|nr:hypothetical protein HDU93_001354 [Gonapodya sp. JEL0774]
MPTQILKCPTRALRRKERGLNLHKSETTKLASVTEKQFITQVDDKSQQIAKPPDPDRFMALVEVASKVHAELEKRDVRSQHTMETSHPIVKIDMDLRHANDSFQYPVGNFPLCYPVGENREMLAGHAR